jgi:hypothetical protein
LVSCPPIQVSLQSYPEHPAVDHDKALAGGETPSIHQLDGFTCCFLGTPRKYPCACPDRLAVGSGDAPDLSYICPPSRATSSLPTTC